MNKTLLLVDGNGLFYRAYHAFPKELTTPSGELIGATFGFTRILLNSIKMLKPTYVAVCFDMKGSTIRKELFAEYKATRSKMPEDLACQIERMHEIVNALEMPVFKVSGFEADDLIGTLSLQAEKAEQSVVVLTGDQDLLQLVSPTTSVYMPASPPKLPTLFSPEKVREKYGFDPLQMIEYKSMRGDPSDNIPGIPGIGDVGATKLIQEFGTLNELYRQLHEGGAPSVKGALRQKILDGEESARMSHQLATIIRDAPITLDLELTKLELKDPTAALTLFKELGFRSLLKDLPASQRLAADAADIFGEQVPDAPLQEANPIDQAVAPVLRAMEQLGVEIDQPYLKSLEKEFAGTQDSYRQQLFVLAGEEFNADSPAQVASMLYEKLGVPTKNVRKGKTGYTTDAAALQELAEEYPIAGLLLQYREIGKLLNTYVLPLQTLADEHSRIHTTYAPDTSTGRLSSKNPNLQNIPIKTAQGRRLRKAFVATPGYLLVAADYSQMELRVAAHLAHDPAMITVFSSGGDFHAETGARMGVDRRTAKMLNFSILYGKGAFGFAKDLKITVAEAKAYIDQYFQTFSALRTYLDTILEKGRENGYVETLYGRKQEYPNLTSSNYQLRSAAEREAVNMPIQGTQADILKMAMADLYIALQQRQMASRLLLTVHDELVLEAPLSEVDAAAALLKEVMVGAAKLDVPVEVSVKTGPNWDEVDAYNEPIA